MPDKSTFHTCRDEAFVVLDLPAVVQMSDLLLGVNFDDLVTLQNRNSTVFSFSQVTHRDVKAVGLIIEGSVSSVPLAKFQLRDVLVFLISLVTIPEL